MKINQNTSIGNFTTFCEKCNEQVDVLQPIVDKITKHYAENDTQKLLTLRNRYVNTAGETMDAVCREGDYIVYKQ